MPVAKWVEARTTGWQTTVVKRLIALVGKAAPEAALSIKWNQPVFARGGPLIYIKVATAHVTLGFWRGAELSDPRNLLEGGAQMKHLKIAAGTKLDEAQVTAFVRQAVELDRGQRSPARRAH